MTAGSWVRVTLVYGALWALTVLIIFVVSKVRASFWWRKRSAAQIRRACASTTECNIAICFHGEVDVMICCETHGLVRIVTDPAIIAAYAAIMRTREGGAA
jgi:hypothetical protein